MVAPLRILRPKARQPSYNVRTMRSRVIVMLMCFVGCVHLVRAQDPSLATMPEKELVVTAGQLYIKLDMAGALPYMQELVKRHPENGMFATSLAGCLYSVATVNMDAQQAAAQWTAAHKEAERAIALHAAGNGAQEILDLTAGPFHPQAKFTGPGAAALNQAKNSFGHGDLDATLNECNAAMVADPGLYDAPLLAGDVWLQRQDFAQAAVWYGKAIAINPNRETGYRFRGDALDRAGQTNAALEQYIAAAVADPYSGGPIEGLTQWSGRHGHTVQRPQIGTAKLPITEMKNGTAVTNIPESQSDVDNGVLSPWAMYQMKRVMFKTDGFAKAYPAENTYRHSLQEEVASIQAALDAIAILKMKDADLDPHLIALRKLNQEGLLECWILLDDADQGISQDYPAYRDGHRELIAKYVREYWIHPAT